MVTVHVRVAGMVQTVRQILTSVQRTLVYVLMTRNVLIKMEHMNVNAPLDMLKMLQAGVQVTSINYFYLIPSLKINILVNLKGI